MDVAEFGRHDSQNAGVGLGVPQRNNFPAVLYDRLCVQPGTRSDKIGGMTPLRAIPAGPKPYTTYRPVALCDDGLCLRSTILHAQDHASGQIERRRIH